MTTLQALAARFRFNERVLERTTEGFSREDWLRRAEGATSHACWILGHITVSRRALLRGIGQPRPDAAWEAAFSKGSQPGDGDLEPCPSDILQDFVASGELLERHFAAMNPAEAAGPYARRMPDGSTSIDGAAHFLHWHETYHLGQLGLLRRACGKPGIA